MSRKDYIKISDAIRLWNEYNDGQIPMRFVRDGLCPILKRDNSSFKPDKFLEACGYK